MGIWLVVWNIFYFPHHIGNGMSSSQLLLTPSFFRGVGETPPTRNGLLEKIHLLYIYIYIYTTGKGFLLVVFQKG